MNTSLSLPTSSLPTSVDAVIDLLGQADYVADRPLATALFLSLSLGRPLLLEGEAGVGKTEIARVLAQTLGCQLVRLQCYEGLDVSGAVYEWNYARQMLSLKMLDVKGEIKAQDAASLEDSIYSEKFLIRRPLLQALDPDIPKNAEPDAHKAPVLLIDELDRADEPFEAFLLEALADYEITIPELGTVRAKTPPIVIVTSNRTREIHDAVKRRCFYHWLDYPDAERELEILRRKAPDAAASLGRDIVAFIGCLRTQDLFKGPGVAETIDWARALRQLDALSLDPQTINETLGVILKYRDDIDRIQGSEAVRLLEESRTM